MRPLSRRPAASPEPDPYASLPYLYDLEHAEFDDDLSLYLNLAEIVGDPIVEFGCGTGRILLPLADAGWRVTGIDRSAAMLEAARSAVAASGSQSRVHLIETDFSQAASVVGGPFGLVIIGLNGFMHLPSLDAQRSCLLAARNALDPRGQLVIDILNPTPDSLRSFDHGVVHEGRWITADGTVIDKFGSRQVSPAAQTIETRLWYDAVHPDGTLHRTLSEFTLRYVHRAELALMLELAGFVEVRFYGTYDLDPFDDASERLIVTADVLPSPPHHETP